MRVPSCPHVLLIRKDSYIIYIHCENDETLKETKMKATKSQALIEALKKGEELTAKQITYRFGIANPTASISALRFNGYAIYANKRTNKLGQTFTKYRLGTPQREVIAAGYRALALGLV